MEEEHVYKKFIIIYSRISIFDWKNIFITEIIIINYFLPEYYYNLVIYPNWSNEGTTFTTIKVQNSSENIIKILITCKIGQDTNERIINTDMLRNKELFMR